MRIDEAGRECADCGQYFAWPVFAKQAQGARGRASYCGRRGNGCAQARSRRSEGLRDASNAQAQALLRKPWGVS